MVSSKSIIAALALLAFKDHRDVAKVLAEEYGIEPVSDDEGKKLQVSVMCADFDKINQQVAVIQAGLHNAQKLKAKPYAPRKIGKPCGFPKNMRRK